MHRCRFRYLFLEPTATVHCHGAACGVDEALRLHRGCKVSIADCHVPKIEQVCSYTILEDHNLLKLTKFPYPMQSHVEVAMYNTKCLAASKSEPGVIAQMHLERTSGFQGTKVATRLRKSLELSQHCKHVNLNQTSWHAFKSRPAKARHSSIRAYIYTRPHQYIYIYIYIHTYMYICIYI